MLRLKTLFFIFLIFLQAVTCQVTGQLLNVNTAYGTVSGSAEDKVAVFKGVPFAAPPVGDLRWKAPQPPAAWSGVKHCDTFPASPVQSDPVPFMMWTQEFITPRQPLSEDCLYLNIWTPASTPKAALPVLVWIHGGGFVSGSGACPIYDGLGIAKKGVIFISINYRLGIFGFLAHPELSKESNLGTSGNFAILDQIQALKWIRQNIRAFGGDPDKVTIAGQSAGSMSVNALVASPLAKGLFRGAIAQSGGLLGGRIARSLEEAEKTGLSVASGTGNIADLRKLSSEQVLALTKTPGARFGPVLDGKVLPENPAEFFRQKKHNDVALLSGWVTGDGALLGPRQTTPEKFREDAIKQYGNLADRYLQIFPANTPEEAQASSSKLALISFGIFPAHLWAGYNSKPSWLYQFSHVPPDKPDFPNYGAFHTSEVPYALHTLHMWDRTWKEGDLRLQKIMSDYWVNFVKTGNPNDKSLPEWPVYKSVSGTIMEFGDTVAPHSGALKKELDFLTENDRP